MAVYGYARCSTSEDKQDINRQIRELKAAGAEEVIFEYEHGDAKVKKNLHMLLDAATAGDTIITLEVSRLSRKNAKSLGSKSWRTSPLLSESVMHLMYFRAVFASISLANSIAFAESR